MKHIAVMLLGVLAGALLAGTARAAEDSPERVAANAAAGAAEVGQAYPGLASAALTHARLADLRAGVLMRAGELSITKDDLATAMKDAPLRIRKQLRKNGFFVLERLTTSKLLLSVARREVARTNPQAAQLSDKDVMRTYFKEILSDVEVSADEVRAFYDQNKAMFGGAALDRVKGQIKQYLLQQKQQEAVSRHIRELGRKVGIEVSAAWVKEQSVLARDNPVDKARLSGKPSLVDFGRGGCGPCDMMTPILERLRKKYEGKANVLFVHVGEAEILAARYGINSIPVQVFFDRTGGEVFRHTGFFPQEEIEKKLTEMGVE